MEPANLGLILDSSLLLDAERRRVKLRDLLLALKKSSHDDLIGISVVTLAELNFGVFRAQTGPERERRHGFVTSLRHELPAFPVTADIALSMGRIRAERAAEVIALSFEDLTIGLTALSLGYSIVTLNVRHFEQIPGLILAPVPLVLGPEPKDMP